MGRVIKQMQAMKAAGPGGLATLNVLFDTGSESNLISEEAGRKVGTSRLAGGEKFEVTMANGQTVVTDRMALVGLRADGNGCLIPTPAAVIPGLEHDLVIGALTMQEFEISIHPATHKVQIGKCHISI